MNTVKILIVAAVIGSFSTVQLSAQSAPNASVGNQGQLILSDGTEIPAPDGTVDANGDLVFSNGTKIQAPNAVVNANGSISIDGGDPIPVPSSPRGGAFIIDWFGSDLLDMDPAKGPEQNQLYWSFTFKWISHFAANNWFWFHEWKTTFYVNPDTGSRNLDDGVWFYTLNLFPGQTQGTWVWFARKNLMNDLRDTDGDGTLDIADNQAGFQLFDASVYVINPDGYDNLGAGWFFMREWPDGNYIIRRSQQQPNPNAWVKLSDPVAPSPNFGG